VAEALAMVRALNKKMKAGMPESMRFVYKPGQLQRRPTDI
ncbi:hypothetical protein, partial [Klebsiella pneumoniae]